MQQVDLIRQRVTRGMYSELTRLRQYISMTDGNQEAVDRLIGESGNAIHAEVVALIMARLGNEVETPVADSNSSVRRAISRVRGK